MILLLLLIVPSPPELGPARSVPSRPVVSPAALFPYAAQIHFRTCTSDTNPRPLSQ